MRGDYNLRTSNGRLSFVEVLRWIPPWRPSYYAQMPFAQRWRWFVQYVKDMLIDTIYDRRQTMM